MDDRRLPLALGLDTFSVVLFVAVGRREHDRDSAIAGLIDTAAPFVIALALAWLVLRAWRRPTDWRIGAGICAITVTAGMLLRNLVFDDGTATSFIIVTTLFLTLFLVGWRVAYTLVERRQQPVRAAR
ncbi:MAG TPA: DUF3054 domain-containing protein [Ilumatobacteraceae bacterium]|nr:DUF3054 domain-containing protein [Ilumatobacteraceae bacterium]